MEDYYPTSPLQCFAFFLNFFFPGLALVVLGLRLYGKTSHASRGGPGTFRHPSTLLGPDDALACLSMLLSAGSTAASYFCIKTNYIGIDLDDIPPHDVRTPWIWMYVVHQLYFPVLAITKSSVLFFLLRLGGQKQGVRRAICALNGLNLALMVAIQFGTVFQCRPIAYFWDHSIPGGTCFNQPVFYLWQGGLNILTDLLVLGVPVCIFLGMKMERRMRIVTLYVFLLGFIVTLIGTVRFVFVYMLFYYDIRFIQHYTMSFSLSAVETNLAIVCACAPTLRGLVRSWFPRALGTDATAVADPDDDDIFTRESKSQTPAGATARDRSRRSRAGVGIDDGAFAYPKDGRGRVLCGHAEVEGLGITPSEEDIMRSNGILRTTDVVVEHGDERSLTRTDTADGKGSRDRQGSTGSSPTVESGSSRGSISR